MKNYNIIMDYILVIISFLALSLTFIIQNIIHDVDFKLLLLVASLYMLIFLEKSLIALYTDKGLVRTI